MRLNHLWLTDFRNYRTAELSPAPFGLTVVLGANGEGKTNLLEAIAYLATLKSFRGSPDDALVRVGAESAVIRSEAHRGERALLIEAEIKPSGRGRVQVNRQPLRRSRDLLGSLQVTVFAPDDLGLVKGGPQGRREYLDDVLVALQPRHDAVRNELDRILRQRNALLKQAGGNPHPPSDVVTTLDVWDQKLVATGTAVVEAREGLVERVGPLIASAYDEVADRSADVVVRYHRSWEGELGDAVAAARTNDLRRAVTTVGPHRDELVLTIGRLPARTHASQGEQRSLALALRLAGHQAVSETLESPPVLLLDDVFSELDQERSEALLGALPVGQVVLTTAVAAPPQARPEVVVRVDDGKLLL